jgi:hypothetical protein
MFIRVTAQAGRLINGQWQPANYGQKPPSLAINSVDECSQRVNGINA